MLQTLTYNSPCGTLLLGAAEGELVLCDWLTEPHHSRVLARLKAPQAPSNLPPAGEASHCGAAPPKAFPPAGGDGNRSEGTLAPARRGGWGGLNLEGASQLDEYFRGERRTFDLPLRMVGTDFQRRVWEEILKVPFGQTITYAELARRVGRPKAVRAVAAAVGSNALNLFIPCHRIVGSGGALTGYAGGLDAKRFLLDLEANAPQRDRHGQLRKPAWLRIDLTATQRSAATAEAIQERGLHTICQSGLCPNRAECWRAGTATLMIGGDVCTRACRFCNTKTGRPLPLDAREPQRVADSIRAMGLRYAVITSVDRDDLPDLGAAHWAETVRQVRTACPDVCIEVLLPDFQGRTELLDLVLDEHPDVVGHNVETVRRLTPSVRSGARYDRSISVLRHIAARGFRCKTGFMLGLGETEEEVRELLRDIRRTGCSALTIGQYLQPTSRHLPVSAYITPARFLEWKREALALGFAHVESGPLVRSSYHAERIVSPKQ